MKIKTFWGRVPLTKKCSPRNPCLPPNFTTALSSSKSLVVCLSVCLFSVCRLVRWLCEKLPLQECKNKILHLTAITLKVVTVGRLVIVVTTKNFFHQKTVFIKNFFTKKLFHQLNLVYQFFFCMNKSFSPKTFFTN